VKTCVVYTLQTVVLVIMCLTVSVEIWVTFRDRTAEAQMNKTKAVENREEIELESQRMKAILEEHRNRQGEQTALDEDL